MDDIKCGGMWNRKEWRRRWSDFIQDRRSEKVRRSSAAPTNLMEDILRQLETSGFDSTRACHIMQQLYASLSSFGTRCFRTLVKTLLG